MFNYPVISKAGARSRWNCYSKVKGVEVIGGEGVGVG